MQRATAMPTRKVAYHDENESVQMRLYKSLKVWSMYADLEESFGTFKVIIIRTRIIQILNNSYNKYNIYNICNIFCRCVKRFMTR